MAANGRCQILKKTDRWPAVDNGLKKSEKDCHGLIHCFEERCNLITALKLIRCRFQWESLNGIYKLS